MKVLLLNEGYSDNLGDQAINDSIKYLLISQNIENIEFQDFSKNIQKIKKIKKINQSNNYNLFKYIKKFIPSKIKWLIKNYYRVYIVSKNNYDKVIIGGGQLILSNDAFAIAMFTWVKLLKYFNNTEIILLAVGCGRKFSLVDKLLFNNVFDNVKKIYVRDYQSQETLKILFNTKSYFIDDVAFIYNKIINKVDKKESILLGMLSLEVYNRYNKPITREVFFETWLNLLNNKRIELNNVKLFYTTESDRNYCLEFKKYIYKKYNISLELLETDSKEILIDALSKSEIVISGRMHALILGLTYGCNIIPYEVSDKIKSFSIMYSENFNLKNLQNSIEEKFKEMIDE